MYPHHAPDSQPRPAGRVATLTLLALGATLALTGCPKPIGGNGGPNRGDAADPGQPGVVRQLGKDNAPMAFVPAGPFVRGSTPDQLRRAVEMCEQFSPEVGCAEDWFDTELPQRTIILSPFWMDVHEVSNAQYERCVAEGGCAPVDRANCHIWMPRDGDWRRLSPTAVRTSFGAPDQPAVCATWDDADAYCRWAGKRLPTEAEWEKAARGTDGRTFPWGDGLPTCQQAHMASATDGGEGCGTRTTGYVGERKGSASTYNILDMAGNVTEWVADFAARDFYANGPQNDPINSAPSERRIIRGGGWNNEPTMLRASYRGVNPPDWRSVYQGFRCAQNTTPDPQSPARSST